MTINKIKIENIKGAKSLEITTNIIPNKPSLLVAPNGFGKSSIAAAFNSLTPSKLKLDDEHLHEGKTDNLPSLTLQLTNKSGSIETFVANDTKNEFRGAIDIFIINSRLQAKATKRNMGRFTTASASLNINEVILIDKIPKTFRFNYSISDARANFGKNGKCLLNIENALNNPAVLQELSTAYNILDKFSGIRIQQKIAGLIKSINTQSSDTTALKQWINDNCTSDLNQIPAIKEVASILIEHTKDIKSPTDAALSAYQICSLYLSNPKEFKSACTYAQYIREKETYTQVISSFDTTWKNVKPKERKGQLVVEFPNAMHISNGQRDSLTFAAMIQCIKGQMGKRDAILVIDEIFDYLDDANLTAAQYYISNLIDSVKISGSRIYPLILTHLNPIYFKNYSFSDQKVYFIDQRTQKINDHFKKIIINRENSTIKSRIESHFIHYHPDEIDLQTEFAALGLKPSWGKSKNFHDYTAVEWEKYKNNDPGYDPFAVCCFVRVKLEEIAYKKISDTLHQTAFINTNKTRSKLEYAASIGIKIPETAFLLGVIYNEGLHIRNNIDNSSPVAAKLENLVIRKMAIEATSG